MQDQFARKIDYLRLSVTDRCNLRCLYCMPEEGVQLKKHDEILSLEELYLITKIATDVGITKARLTGGEPLVRRGIADLIKMIRDIPNLKDLSLTTNGILLGQYAPALKAAGLNRVNISLDTLDPDKFRYITRGGDINKVLKGIESTLEEGLEPVKINCVLVNGFNDQEIHKFVLMSENKPLHIRFIELMPIGEGHRNRDDYLPLEPLKNFLIKTYGLLPLTHIKTNGPAEEYGLPGGKGSIGFIGAVSNHFCGKCNRLRVTADGKIKPCLDSDYEIDILDAIRKNKDIDKVKELFIKAIDTKPLGHNMNSWEEGHKRLMSQIGG